MACTIFAAISGSSAASAATFGKIAIPPQRYLKYSPRHIYGSVAAGGTLGILIPPSIPMIIYGAMTETSIPKLFAAGILPGLVLALFYMTAILIMAVRNPKIAPSVPAEEHTWKIRVHSLKILLPLFGVIAIVLGGIYLGLFTPTEAAAIGALGVLLMVIGFGRFSFKFLWNSLLSAGRTTAWMSFIFAGANILGFGLGQSGIAKSSVVAMVSLNLSPVAFISLLMVFYVILGCLVEGLSLLLLTISIVFPIVEAMGFNTIWFGIMMVLMAECALVTPPVGLILYILQGISEESLTEVSIGAFPFVLVLFGMIALLIAFPNLALFIPSFM